MALAAIERRARTVNELGIAAEFVHHPGLIGSDELRLIHPQAKIPAAVINGASILVRRNCMQLCDLHPEKGLYRRVRRKEDPRPSGFHLRNRK